MGVYSPKKREITAEACKFLCAMFSFAEEEQLKSMATLLEKLQAMKSTLDSEHTKGMHSWTVSYRGVANIAE